MAFVIAAACIDVKDKSCIEVCPVSCIYGDPEDRMCYIHPGDCIDCAVCESACPVQAIFPDKSAPADSLQFIELNELWFRDKEAARKAVAALKPKS
jgi:NAD-dependent dihydropyrimidine dehydrogenase PreA subunit